MNIIVCYEIAAARYFAEQIKHWSKKDYKIVLNQTEHLRGLVNVKVWILELPRHNPTMYQLSQREIMMYILEAQMHRIIVEKVVMP